MASTAASQCTCVEFGSGLPVAGVPCPVHPNGLPQKLHSLHLQTQTNTPDYLRGFRDGVKAALELMRGKNADQ